MQVLVTGATGTVGSDVCRQLADEGVGVRALTRDASRVATPGAVTPFEGDMTDPVTMREAVDGIDGLFLLSPVSLSELAGSITTLELAHEAGVTNIVYLSVIHADRFTDPPHFAAKAAVERMLVDLDIPASILRPGYYMQNDAGSADMIRGSGKYSSPVGNRSVLMTDTRDLAAVAATALLERLRSSSPLPSETLDVVDPKVLTGDEIAAIWAEELNTPVVYGGDDLDAFETAMAAFAPAWQAYDMRLMMGRFQRDGMVAAVDSDQRLRALLGRPTTSYRDYVHDIVTGEEPMPNG